MASALDSVGPDDVARTLSARYYKDGSEILVPPRPPVRPRRLTPRECARLMGFDRAGAGAVRRSLFRTRRPTSSLATRSSCQSLGRWLQAMAPFVADGDTLGLLVRPSRRSLSRLFV